jgi:hypothetical protein
MEKILAIVVLVVVAWWAVPYIAHGEFIAPTAVAPNSWVTSYNLGGSNYSGGDQVAQSASQPSQGYGFFRFDFWNNPPTQGRPVTQSDTRLRSPSSERASL